MEIIINTKEDSKDEIKKTIKFLESLIDNKGETKDEDYTPKKDFIDPKLISKSVKNIDKKNKDEDADEKAQISIY